MHVCKIGSIIYSLTPLNHLTTSCSPRFCTLTTLLVCPANSFIDGYYGTPRKRFFICKIFVSMFLPDLWC